MFKVLLLISFFAYDRQQQGNLTIDVRDAQEVKSCTELLSSEEYIKVRNSFIDQLSTLGYTDITVNREDCTDLNNI